MEVIGLGPPVHHVGRGRGIPDVADAERSMEIEANHALMVHVDGLIDEVEGVGRLVWQLHRRLVSILEIERGHVFLPQDIVELGIVLDIWL